MVHLSPVQHCRDGVTHVMTCQQVNRSVVHLCQVTPVRNWHGVFGNRGPGISSSPTCWNAGCENFLRNEESWKACW